MKTIGSLTGLGTIYETIIAMNPVQFPICPSTGRKAIKSVDELLKILKAMQLNCLRSSCMILIDADRKSVNGLTKITFSVSCDEISPNKRHSLHVYYTYDGKHTVLYTVGKSFRGRKRG